MFFSNCLKFNADSKNAIKLRQNVFNFLDKGIRIGNGNFSLLRREYF